MKRLTGIITVLSVCLCITACGGNNAGYAPPENTDETLSEETSKTAGDIPPVSAEDIPEAAVETAPVSDGGAEETVAAAVPVSLGGANETENNTEPEQPAPDNDVKTVDPEKPVIALTFDDGPNTTNSVKILDELEARGLVATYFVIGGNINENSAEVMKRAYTLGCEYANHSWGWDSLGDKEADVIIGSLTRTSDKIAEVLGEDARPKFFRAPNLNTSRAMIETVRELGYPLMNGIMGSDWEAGITPEQIFDLVVPKVKDGSIILLHDGGSNSATAEGIGDILDALLEQGFQFVTLSELFEIKGADIEPGKTYNDVK